MKKKLYHRIYLGRGCIHNSRSICGKYGNNA